jgi:3-hydroxy-9,10-secoandrosta-1,3,5(10)-triene-9,17-dione monooxygenase
MVAAPVEGQEAEGVGGMRQFLIPEAEYEIVDDWHVAGLRGTGSKQIVIDPPLFVPGHRTIGFLEMLGSNPPGAEVNDGYVYRMELGPYFGTILLGPVLGIAEGALAQYLDTTRTKVGVVRRNRIAESEPVQLRVAESAAEIYAAGAIVDKMVDLLDQRGAAGTELTSQERVESMRDRAYATRTCVNAVHRLVRQMGATGLADDNPVQRHFRDISAAQGQIGLNWDRNGGTYGKWLLGVETGDAAIDGTPSSSRDAEAGNVG